MSETCATFENGQFAKCISAKVNRQKNCRYFVPATRGSYCMYYHESDMWCDRIEIKEELMKQGGTK